MAKCEYFVAFGAFFSLFLHNHGVDCNQNKEDL
jgi:hypothetical protein